MAQPPPVLASMRPSVRAYLLEQAVPRRLAPDQVLALSGDDVRLVYAVRSGILKLSSRDLHGRQTTLGLAVPTDLLGLASALTGEGHHLDAIPLTDVTLLAFCTDRFVHALTLEPQSALTAARCVAHEARALTQTVLERTMTSGCERLAGRLLELGDRFGRNTAGTIRLELPLNQSDIGELAGLSRESVCKTMRWFKSVGAAEYDTGRRLILRPEVLEAIRRGESLPGRH
jgi:CRP-like cAMP-binding protein